VESVLVNTYQFFMMKIMSYLNMDRINVSEYMKRMQEALQPLPMKLIHTRILISGQYDIEAINRIINTTGFLRELLTQGECL
jgi:hypothetical protein